ncbi:MAG: hypothetical protein GY935_16205 [Gammaproteobacteria bacterium]|nr:hypothetical protein [Gammaproteobacteria bacterium]
MEINAYQAPTADLTVKTDDVRPFYVVARGKFLALYFLTLGMYGIYWFYRHWSANREFAQSTLWPIPRAIFSIFYAHSLFAQIYRRGRSIDSELNWNPGVYASLYVVFEILGNLVDQLEKFGLSEPVIISLSAISMIIVAMVLLRAQMVVNIACEDPRGKANNRITLANMIWMLIGVLLWLVILFGIATAYGWISLNFA